MKLPSTAALTIVLSATAVWAQTQTSVASSDRSLPTREPVGIATASAGGNENASAVRAQAALHQRVQDLENTLTKMHALLKQMRTRTEASAAKDPMAKTNLELWELMLGTLDNQFEQLKIATHTREDLDSRRSALYKQAEAKAAAEAHSAQSHEAMQPTSTQPGSSPASSQN
jgi:hypothetical protein